MHGEAEIQNFTSSIGRDANLEVSDDSNGERVHASVHSSGDGEAVTYKSPFAKKPPRGTYRSTQTFFDDDKL